MRKRRRSTALRDSAGVYHVASRLSYEGFRATVAHRLDATGADVFAGLSGGLGTVALMVRTTACPPRFVEGEGECEWRVGKGAAFAADPGLFVALVDLGRDGDLPSVWIVPSAKVRGRFTSTEARSYRYYASAADLAPYEDDWDAIEEHLLSQRASATGWFTREELAERYGEDFVDALDAEASRILGAQNSTTRAMADERFPAEELAEASALLRVLFGRWMEEERDKKRGGEA